MDLAVNKCEELSLDELMTLDGGTFWGVVGGTFTVIAGAAECVGGGALLVTPEPTGATKVAGYAACTVGASTVVGGIATIVNNI